MWGSLRDHKQPQAAAALEIRWEAFGRARASHLLQEVDGRALLDHPPWGSLGPKRAPARPECLHTSVQAPSVDVKQSRFIGASTLASVDELQLRFIANSAT